MMSGAGPSSASQGSIPSHTFIDTEDLVAAFIDIILHYSQCTPTLYIDLEGINLSRHGTVSIMQILVDKPEDHTYLIDVHTLGRAAFTTPGNIEQYSLRQILEATNISKVFFDVRRDSDALFSQFGVRLASVQDLQLMELAIRSPPQTKKYLSGLAACIEKDYPWWQHGKNGPQRKRQWKATKERGMKLFSPSRGGKCENFNVRPLPRDLVAYCVGDVVFMPSLLDRYNVLLLGQGKGRISKKMVEAATADRIRVSQSAAGSVVEGQNMALAPAGWY